MKSAVAETENAQHHPAGLHATTRPVSHRQQRSQAENRNDEEGLHGDPSQDALSVYF